MGSSVEDSVADGEGECWECSDLFIADASAFPTASGTAGSCKDSNYVEKGNHMPLGYKFVLPLQASGILHKKVRHGLNQSLHVILYKKHNILILSKDSKGCWT